MRLVSWKLLGGGGGGGGEASRLGGPWRKQPRGKTQGARLWQRMNFVKEDGLNYPGSGPFLFS